jgi:phosphatidylglycerol:prolipoprotein diacylglycerol transferase
MGDLVGHIVITAFITCYFLNGLLYEPAKFWAVVENPIRLFDFKNYYLGLSSYGGFVGAVLGTVIWRWRRKLPAVVVGECAVWAFPFAWTIGRIACFTAKDHPGKVTDFFLAVDNYHYGEPDHFVEGEAVYLPRHDLGLYEAMYTAVIAVLFYFLAKKPRKPGFFFGLFPILYAIPRFPLDYLRVDDATYGGLTPGQWGSILLVFAGGFLLYWTQTRPTPELPKAAQYDPEAEARAAAEEEAKKKKGKKPGKKLKKKRN